MSTHILGIRHHGPGSARHVKAFLEELQPDIVLVEGPPEADALLARVGDKELQPPVAILCYQQDDLQHSVFYPFAVFSPEWQAILYAKQHNKKVRFFDLPIANQLAVEKEDRMKKHQPDETDTTRQASEEEPVAAAAGVREDPISYLSRAAGYEESEKWWEQMFEHRIQGEQVFEAVQEAMQSLRDELPSREDRLERLREAHMRKMIRQAEKDLFGTVAIVCGAWHVPALLNRSQQKEDNELLRGLPKTKIECTWIPWTYNRLSYHSGYGAGIVSPGWYEHVWTHPADDGTRWMSLVARLFRKGGMDTSVAHVIEAVRLAESLAAMRQLSKAGLEELNEATLSVLCNGESIQLAVIREELIIGNKLGEVPDSIPKPPLQVDMEKEQKRLRLPPTADFKDCTLDLRNDNDLERSIFLHRLQLLEISWGVPSTVSGKGTFKEQWRLQYDPQIAIDIIEKGAWGNTVEKAASAYVVHQATRAPSLPDITRLLEQTLPAELHAAVEVLVQQLNNLAAASGDVIQLMEAVPSLVTVSRYGNVRKTDAALVNGILEGMITRICVSLPNAATGVDEAASQRFLELFAALNEAVSTLQHAGMLSQWKQVLELVSTNPGSSPVLAGYALRIMADQKWIHGDELVKNFALRMSRLNDTRLSAAWLEGFLKGSGTMLLLDEDLWTVVNGWVAGLDDRIFMEVLPLLRRTFSKFTKPERKKIGEKIKGGKAPAGVAGMQQGNSFDEDQAKRGIPVVLQLLGLSKSGNNE
ncbi:MAG: hypothetical protein INR73_08900 [Williamsia sp.]|nr:hypothetical protein [Williamsia sp.]